MAKDKQSALPLPPVEIPRQPIYTVWPPRVESRESLDLLVAEVARVDALEARLDADAKDDVARIKTEAAQRMFVNIDAGDGKGFPLPLADWRAKLVAAAEKFADKHRAELLEDGRKCFDLNHGRVGWEDSRPALEPLPDFDEEGNDKILKKLLKELREALQNVADFTDGGARFVDVKLKWRKKELLAAHEDQDLPLAILKKTSFTIREEREEFYIRPPKNGDVASQSAEKPK